MTDKSIFVYFVYRLFCHQILQSLVYFLYKSCHPLKKVIGSFSATLHLKFDILSSTPFSKFDWRFNPPSPAKRRGCILCHAFVHSTQSMLLNVFCFLFLFRLFSFLVEMCNRNAKWHCAFTRSQGADPKFHCKIWLGIEIL